jgi:ParB-like chromosome segregation protein Spo0J
MELMTTELKITQIKVNPNNPRLIKDDKFRKLVKSIQEFPEMLNIRPIVVNTDMVILGGNMRYKACVEAGLKTIPVIVVDLSEDKQKEFLIKDNVSGGEWDWDMLANEWNTEELKEWGLDVWQTPVDVDYSILDDDDVSDELDGMLKGVKKAIQIEFENEHYEEALELVKFWRNKELYIGGFLVEQLKLEKLKLDK